MSISSGKVYHPVNGTVKEIWRGFSWPCLFFGFLWCIDKGMWRWALITLIPFTKVFFAFFANDQYTLSLLNRGYLTEVQWHEKNQTGVDMSNYVQPIVADSAPNRMHRLISTLFDIYRTRTVIKISSWICGTCLIVWVIFVAIISSSVNDWVGMSMLTAFIAIGSFALSYLGGHIIKGNKGAIRLGVLISVSWIAGYFVYVEPYKRHGDWNVFIVFGIIPIISYLGILWVISGFLPEKKKMENS